VKSPLALSVGFEESPLPVENRLSLLVLRGYAVLSLRRGELGWAFAMPVGVRESGGGQNRLRPVIDWTWVTRLLLLGGTMALLKGRPRAGGASNSERGANDGTTART
jgi:hypothetical protein